MMPYRTVQMSPEEILDHAGYRIVRVYKNDDYDQPLEYWMAVENEADGEYEEFDIRELPGYADIKLDDCVNPACRLERLRPLLELACENGTFRRMLGIEPGEERLFFVDVGRISARELTFEVRARTEEQARDKALDMAVNADFSKGREQGNPDYEVMEVRGDS